MSKMIPLTQGKVAQVSDHRYEYLNQFNWFAVRDKKNGKWYASRKQGNAHVYMHQEIMDFPIGVEIDHRDRDGLNNQDENLRLCSHSQNMANVGLKSHNTSGYKGVCWGTKRRKWRAYINVSGKQIYLGFYATPEIAARAYDDAAKKYFGEFASLNFNNA